MHERLKFGTAVIDMRYENPLITMVEDAGAADVIAGKKPTTRWESAAVLPGAGHRWLALFWLQPQ